MLKGKITDDLELIVEIELIFGKKTIKQIAVVDTGFNGFLSVPAQLILESEWKFVGYEKYEIATGEIIEAKVYVGEINFDDRRYKVEVLDSQSKDILLGTKLLEDKIININFKEKSLIIEG